MYIHNIEIQCISLTRVTDGLLTIDWGCYGLDLLSIRDYVAFSPLWLARNWRAGTEHSSSNALLNSVKLTALKYRWCYC